MTTPISSSPTALTGMSVLKQLPNIQANLADSSLVKTTAASNVDNAVSGAENVQAVAELGANLDVTV